MLSSWLGRRAGRQVLGHTDVTVSKFDLITPIMRLQCRLLPYLSTKSLQRTGINGVLCAVFAIQDDSLGDRNISHLDPLL